MPPLSLQQFLVIPIFLHAEWRIDLVNHGQWITWIEVKLVYSNSLTDK